MKRKFAIDLAGTGYALHGEMSGYGDARSFASPIRPRGGSPDGGYVPLVTTAFPARHPVATDPERFRSATPSCGGPNRTSSRSSNDSSPSLLGPGWVHGRARSRRHTTAPPQKGGGSDGARHSRRARTRSRPPSLLSTTRPPAPRTPTGPRSSPSTSCSSGWRRTRWSRSTGPWHSPWCTARMPVSIWSTRSRPTIVWRRRITSIPFGHICWNWPVITPPPWLPTSWRPAAHAAFPSASTSSAARPGCPWRGQGPTAST